MMDKAQAVLQRPSQRQALRHWKRLNNPERRAKILNESNREHLDDVGPLRGDQSMAVPKDMNDLEAGHDEFVKSLAPTGMINGRTHLSAAMSSWRRVSR